MNSTANAPFGGCYSGKKVLLTGHTGFKGSWLSAWLTMLGADVCGFSDRIPTNPSLFEAAGLAQHVRHELGDIRDRARVVALLDEVRPDFVFHLAAQAIVSTSYAEPLETMSVNVIGTATIVDALRSVDWNCVAVMITSDKVYDNVEWAWGYRETDRLGGKDLYSGSKACADLAINSYFHSFLSKPNCPVRLVTARAGNVIGGGDWARDRIVADCVRAWRNGDLVEVRNPRATRPWQHVLEPLSGYLALGSALTKGSPLHGSSFNFGPRAEQNATVLELLSNLAEIWGFDDPSSSYTVTSNLPFHEASLLKLNIDLALLTLCWTPTLSYRECVEFTGMWYRDVVRDGKDARCVTLDQIRKYQSLASERATAWFS